MLKKRTAIISLRANSCNVIAMFKYINNNYNSIQPKNKQTLLLNAMFLGKNTMRIFLCVVSFNQY